MHACNNHSTASYKTLYTVSIGQTLHFYFCFMNDVVAAVVRKVFFYIFRISSTREVLCFTGGTLFYK